MWQLSVTLCCLISYIHNFHCECAKAPNAYLFFFAFFSTKAFVLQTQYQCLQYKGALPHPLLWFTLIHQVDRVIQHCKSFVLIVRVLHYSSSQHVKIVSYHITTVLLQVIMSRSTTLIHITTSATTQQVSVSSSLFYISHFDTYILQCNDYIIFWCKFIVSASELYLLHFD